MTDETMDTSEMSDDQFEAYLDTEDAAAEAEINAQDSADLADGDDSDDLYASVGNVDAQDAAADLDVADDVPEVPELTADQIELDEFRRERDARSKSFADHCEDMDRPRSFGERRAAAVWSRNQELERRESVAATSPDAEAENEAKAVETVTRFMENEDADPGPGFISGEGSKHDAAEAAQNRRNAMANWDNFCNDPDS